MTQAQQVEKAFGSIAAVRGMDRHAPLVHEFDSIVKSVQGGYGMTKFPTDEQVSRLIELGEKADLVNVQ